MKPTRDDRRYLAYGPKIAELLSQEPEPSDALEGLARHMVDVQYLNELSLDAILEQPLDQAVESLWDRNQMARERWNQVNEMLPSPSKLEELGQVYDLMQ